MTGPSSLRQAQRAMLASRALARGGPLRDRICCSAHELSPTQWHALGELWEARSLSMNELAERLRITRSTLTRIMDLLEKKNLARRKPCREDRRQILVSLTSRGEELFHEVEGSFVHAHRQILAGIPAIQREQLVHSLELLARAQDMWLEREASAREDRETADHSDEL